MSEDNKIDITEKLADLQKTFQRLLPEKVQRIEQLWNKLQSSDAVDTELADLHRMVHRLTGSGGTFGAMAVSTISRELEIALKSLIDDKDGLTLNINDEPGKQINDLVSSLKQTSEQWQPSSIPFLPTDERKHLSERDSNLIYLIEDDELLSREIADTLSKLDFQVHCFHGLKEFEAALTDVKPAAVIVDMILDEGDIAGAMAVELLNQHFTDIPPVIFISVRNDMEARLAAARVGAVRYFSKPLDMDNLVQTVDGLTSKVARQSHKILVIDDDENLLEYYATVLREAGMEVKALTNALDCLDMLTEFNPDLVILDIYMPECSGPELAQVIRQDDNWAQMPIMFLSTEINIDRQLMAMSMGGDDFLIKPITPEHLVVAVDARVRRARWIRRLNKELKNSLLESKYRQVALDQHAIVSIANAGGAITFVNDRFIEISGYSKEELIGQNHRIIKSKRHPQKFYENIWRTISSGKVWQGEICNLSKSGCEYWVESTIVPFLDDKGKPYQYVSVRTDITALRENEERLQRSQSFANIGTWDWDIGRNKIHCSDRIWNLLDISDQNTEINFDGFIDAMHPDDRYTMLDAFDASINDGIDFDIEHRVIRQDGSIRWLQERGDVVRSDTGESLHMLGVMQDVTERKNAEQILIKTTEAAEHANSSKSQFLSNMSHELRTPLNAILGFSQLLQMDSKYPLSEEQLDNINEINKAGGHLLELVNDVLDLARVEAGHIDFSLETVLLGEVIVECLHLIMPLAEKRGIEISISYDDVDLSFENLQTQNESVWVDRIRFKQALLNLLSNAVKYNEENGKIMIACNVLDDKRMRISISDTGQGLTEAQQSDLFTPFNRLGADDTDTEGTGIGLVITKRIIELMGGDISVNSRAGEGSAFLVEVPLDVRTEKETVVKTIEPDKAEQQVVDTGATVSNTYTMLYVEDNPANLRLVAQLISRRPNIHLWSAHEPFMGLELAAEHKPDLILLDINLPEIDGFEVLKRLRQQDVICNTLVIAISANAMPSDIKSAIDAGFDDYITKPIDVAVFLKSIDKALENISGVRK